MAFNYLNNVALVKKVGKDVFVVEDPFLVQDILANREDLISAADIATDAAENAAQDAAEIKESLEDVQGVFEENKKLILLTDDYLLYLLNVASSSSYNFSERDIKAYHLWEEAGLEKLRQVATIALHSSEETKTDIEQFLDWFNQEESKEAQLLTVLSTTSEKTKQQINNAIVHYDDDIRTRNILIRTYVEKPVVLFIVAGQSNSVGNAEAPAYEVADYAGQFWNWRTNPAQLAPLRDPVYRSSTRGTAWPAFGREFFACTGRKVVILSVGSNGSYVTDQGSSIINTWYGDASVLRQTATMQYQACIAALGTKNTDWILGGLIWIQGEQETGQIGSGSMQVSEWIEGTLSVFSFFRTLTGVSTMPIYLSQIGLSEGTLTNETSARGYAAVQNAQVQICTENKNNYLAFTGAKSFLKAKYMADTVHYNQKGYNILGEAVARFISNHQIF